MAEKPKIRIDGIVSEGDIPDDIEELELECKEIGKKALANHEALRSVTLINTEIIGERAFIGCRALEKIELPETLRKIGNEAFADSQIKHLVIPPSVTELGDQIILTADLRHRCRSVIEIYIKDGKPAFLSPNNIHLGQGEKIVVRSAESGEILYQFMVLNFWEMVLTDHGVDFTSYDRNLILNATDVVSFEAARMRIKDPVDMSEETLLNLKNSVSESAAERLKNMIYPWGSYRAYDFNKFENYDEIKVKHIMELIAYSVTKSKPEVTEILIKRLYEKIDEISNSELMEAIGHSARLGLTEITALLMQKFHERGGSGGNNQDLEL